MCGLRHEETRSEIAKVGLGDGTTSSRNTPLAVPGLTDMIGVAAGSYHSVALKNDGTVWAWGYNGNGQVGDGSTTNRSSPVLVIDLTGVTAIATGDRHTLALKNNGTVWAWGYNGYGQLGNGTLTSSTSAVQVTGLTGVASIAAGENYSLALKSDGTVWAWGYNGYGQLGDGSTTSELEIVRVSGLTGVVAIAAGDYHALAVKSDGTVWGWGYNPYGELGNGSVTQELTPVQATGLTTAVDVAAGVSHSLAIQRDGSIWAWGLNSVGQFGVATPGSSTVPIKVISGGFGANQAAVMQSPVPGTTLSGATVTFTWGDTGAAAYWLDVGTVQGQGNIFGQNVGTATSQTVNGIPTNGQPVYVKLWSFLNGVWTGNPYTYTAAPGSTLAVMSTPVPGSTLSGSTVAFTWTAGVGASAYWLDVGTVQGQGNIFGQNVGTATSQTVSGIPTTGQPIYVKLWSFINGVWTGNSYTYTAASPSPLAMMLTPTPGSTLSSCVTFTWTAGVGASAYWLDVGTVQGQGNIFGQNVGTATSQTVCGIPTNGQLIYVKLWSFTSGSWGGIPYTYTAGSGSGIATPVPGSVLPSPSATFTWTAVTGADQYWLDVGSAVGIGDYFGAATTGTSIGVNSLPCDARTVYVQLWAHISGNWQTPQRYTYTASAGCAALTSPFNNAVFPGTSVTFTWNAISGADQYWLDMGNSIGVGDIFGGSTTATGITVNNIPCDSRTLYGQLWTHSGGVWHNPGRYNFVAWGACGRLTTPTPGSTLPGSVATFNWNAGTGVTAYWLDVGTVLGRGNIYGANVGTALSQTVLGIPVNGSPIYVQLWSQIGGVWYLNRYSYTAF